MIAAATGTENLGPALAAFAVFLVLAIGVVAFVNKRTRDKMRDTVGSDGSEPPKSLFVSKRTKRAAAELQPAKEAPTIEELVAEEAAATGVNDIPGGEELDVSLKLRVFWRDEVVRKGCTDGRLEFRLDEGVTPYAAATDDVRLVCVRDGSSGAPPE